MIKVNVITNNLNWFNYIKNPNNYIDRKIKKLNSKNKNYSKKAMDGVNQRIGNFIRNFDNPFFKTGKSELIKLLIRDLVDSSRSLDKLLKDHESIK